MSALPLLRAPRSGIDPRRTVVACHMSALDEAVDFYRNRLKQLPAFYVLDLSEKIKKNINIHNFADLTPDMDVQVYCSQSRAPRSNKYIKLSRELLKKHIRQYSIERYSTKLFYKRNRKEVLTDKDWGTILHFTNACCDADSQYTYMGIAKARTEGEPGFIPMADYKQYFHPQVSVTAGDIVCEGGIDNGETTLHFFNEMEHTGKIYAFEPVPISCKRLYSLFSSLEGIKLEQLALWETTGKIFLRFNQHTNSASTVHVDTDVANCPCTSIDDYFLHNTPLTIIKLDVEGAEPKVLLGAKQILAKYSPKLMISIYHFRNPDWITIPHMLLNNNFPYNYYVGHHTPWYAESILYCGRNPKS